MRRLYWLIFLLLFLTTPLAAAAATLTIVHSCDNYGEVIPCG